METDPDEQAFGIDVQNWKSRVMQIPGVVAVGESLVDQLPCLKVCFRDSTALARAELPPFPDSVHDDPSRCPWGQPPRIVKAVTGDFFAQ